MDIDLTPAIGVAAKQIRVKQSGELHNQIRLARYWDEGLTAPDEVENVTRQARAAIEAAAPLIEAAVRAQIAQNIERRANVLDHMSADHQRFGADGIAQSIQMKAEGVAEAARIARGES